MVSITLPQWILAGQPVTVKPEPIEKLRNPSLVVREANLAESSLTIFPKPSPVSEFLAVLLKHFEQPHHTAV